MLAPSFDLTENRAWGRDVRLIQRTILAGVVVLGVTWGLCIGVPGVRGVVLAMSEGEGLRDFRLWLGLSGIAAGQFVFMEVVADRLVRVGRRAALDAVEFLTGGVMVVLFGVGATLWTIGGPG